MGDLTGLLDHLGEESAVFIGLDFGVFAIYDLAYRVPARVRAIIGLENPATPHNPQLPPLVEAAQWARNHFVHIHYFAPYGPADGALNAQPREFLTGVFYALSGDYHYLDVWKHPPGTSYLEALPQPPPLPWSWLTELEMEFFVSEYARTGFTGGLNWYRAMDLRWAQRRQFEGVRNPAPFFFIGSERDCDLEAWHGDDPLGQLRLQYEDVRGVAMLAEAGHMMQMERPAEVNGWILKFLGAAALTADDHPHRPAAVALRALPLVRAQVPVLRLQFLHPERRACPGALPGAAWPRPGRAGAARSRGRTVQTVFLGGGTPSLFSPRSIERVLALAHEHLGLAPDAEVTLEANPGTIERGALPNTAPPA